MRNGSIIYIWYCHVLCQCDAPHQLYSTATPLIRRGIGFVFHFWYWAREHMIMESDTGDFPLMFVICQSLRWTRRRSIISAVAHLEHQKGTKEPCDNIWSSHNYKNTGDHTKLCLCQISDLMLIMIRQCSNSKSKYDCCINLTLKCIKCIYCIYIN